MAEPESWNSPDSLREPRDENEREQAEKLGMLVITGIESIRSGQKFSGLPCGFEALIKTPGGKWELTVHEVIEQ